MADVAATELLKAGGSGGTEEDVSDNTLAVLSSR